MRTPLGCCRRIGVLAAFFCVPVMAQAQEPSPNSPNAIWQTQFQQPAAILPRERKTAPEKSSSNQYRMTLPNELFGNVNQINQLAPHRRKLAQSPAANAVFGAEAKGRVSSDVGDLLRKSISSHGVSTQDRTPIVTDTRIRGQKAGQVLASGSYWSPVRADLDTMMNKIDSRLIQVQLVQAFDVALGGEDGGFPDDSAEGLGVGLLGREPSREAFLRSKGLAV